MSYQVEFLMLGGSTKTVGPLRSAAFAEAVRKIWLQVVPEVVRGEVLPVPGTANEPAGEEEEHPGAVVALCCLEVDVATGQRFLAVNGQRYELLRVGTGGFDLVKGDGTVWEVRHTWHAPGKSWWRCSCPDHLYRKRRCKHLLALEMVGLIHE